MSYVDPGTLAYPRFGFCVMGQGKGYFTSGAGSIREKIKRAHHLELTFYNGWGTQAERNDLCDDLHSASQGIKVEHYTVLNQVQAVATNPQDIAERATMLTNGWYLRRVGGQQVSSDNVYNCWETNPGDTTPTDVNGDRWPQWKAKYEVNNNITGTHVDIVRPDNMFGRNRIIFYNSGADNATGTYTSITSTSPDTTGITDLNLLNDGIARSNKDITGNKKLRAGNVALLSSLRSLMPSLEITGNLDNDGSSSEYQGVFDGILMEGLIGASYGTYSRAGGTAALRFYGNCQRNVRNPVRSKVYAKSASATLATILALMRAEICFTLMGDAVFVNTNLWPEGIKNGGALISGGAGVIPDELLGGVLATTGYLGAPIDRMPYKPLMNNVWVRRFTKGMVLFNAGTSTATVSSLNLLLPSGKTGMKKLTGIADAAFNDGTALGTSVNVPVASASVGGGLVVLWT